VPGASTIQSVQPPPPKKEENAPDLPREVEGFRLHRELGRGGMGIVYEAAEKVSGRIVALKVLAHDLSVSEEAFARFKREARLAGAISDANCVFVYGAHEIEGSPAISMELVGGETLEDRLKHDEPVPIETAVGWAIEILDGLDAAQEVGVVHRDVKPSNCFLTDDGHVKVGDFGLARTLEMDVALTQSGAFLGSPLYASPEQVRGRPLDLRSDMYSAAATLYALLTGSSPFSGGSMGEVLARILSESPVPPQTIRPEIPKGLEKVVLKAMSREPSSRYKSYAAFRDALAPFTQNALRPARLPLRVVAMLIDSVALGAVNAVVMMTEGMRFMDPERPWMLRSPGALLAFLTVPLLYFGLAEGLLGATPGKWIFGQRVVSVATGQPSTWRSLLRAGLYFSTGILTFLILRTLDIETQSVGSLVSSAISIGLTLAIFGAARPSNGWRGLHEFASGTRTTQRPLPFQRFRPTAAPLETPVHMEDGLPSEVGGYSIEGVLDRTPAGRMLRGRDPELARTVWIHERQRNTGEDRLHGRERPTHLRWLTSLDEGGLAYDVFEDPGGVSVTALQATAGPVPWQFARPQLEVLVDELATLESEAAGAGLSIDQIWIDRSWRIRVLDTPVGSETTETLPPVEVIGELARLLLGTGAGLPPDLPVHAEAVVKRLLTREQPFASAEAVRAELADWEGRPTVVGRKLRAARVALASAFPIIGGLFAMLMVLVGVLLIMEVGPGMSLLKRIESAEIVQRDHPESGAKPPAGDMMKAHQILIAESFLKSWGPMIVQELSERQTELLEEARAAYPSPTLEDIAWAREQLMAAETTIPRMEDEIVKILTAGTTLTLALISSLWLIVSLTLSFILRGGLSFRLTGIRIRSRSGALASRWRCLLRTLVAGTPALMLAGSGLAILGAELMILGAIISGLAIALALGGIAYALLATRVSLQDRIAGTRLVPR